MGKILIGENSMIAGVSEDSMIAGVGVLKGALSVFNM